MNITLDAELIRNVVSEAVLNAMTAESRAILIKGALDHLLTPPKDNYGNKKTCPLQEAFNSALSRQAEETARELMESDSTVKDRIKTLLSEALEVVFETKRDETVSKIADVITKGMSLDRDRY